MLNILLYRNQKIIVAINSFIYSLLINFIVLLIVAHFTYHIRPIILHKIYSVDLMRLSGKKPSEKVVKKEEKIVTKQLPPDTENISTQAKEIINESNPPVYQDVSELDMIPEILYMVKPEYPEKLRFLNKESKRIVLKFLVNYSGHVEQVTILEPAEEELFNQSSIEAVKKWRFATPLANGKPVSVWFTLPIRFKLK